MSNDDEIAQAFEDISVTDFLRETSAMDRITYGPEHAHVTSGRNNFMGFVDAQVRRCHDQAENAKFHAFSTLHNKTEQRHYHPDDDETAPQYAERLAREALEMDASWFFTAMLAPGRAFNPDEESPPEIDADNPEELKAALESGLVRMSICWFAQSNEGAPERRSGIIVLNEHLTPESSIEGEIDADNNPFHYVMGNHA